MTGEGENGDAAGRPGRPLGSSNQNGSQESVSYWNPYSRGSHVFSNLDMWKTLNGRKIWARRPHLGA